MRGLLCSLWVQGCQEGRDLLKNWPWVFSRHQHPQPGAGIPLLNKGMCVEPEPGIWGKGGENSQNVDNSSCARSTKWCSTKISVRCAGNWEKGSQEQVVTPARTCCWPGADCPDYKLGNAVFSFWSIAFRVINPSEWSTQSRWWFNETEDGSGSEGSVQPLLQTLCVICVSFFGEVRNRGWIQV